MYKQVSDYILRERRTQTKVEAHAFDIAYYELLEGQYKRRKDTEGEKSTNDMNEGEEDVIIEAKPAEMDTTSSKRVYQKVKHAHIEPDEQNHVLGNSRTCRGISLTFEDNVVNTTVVSTQQSSPTLVKYNVRNYDLSSGISKN